MCISLFVGIFTKPYLWVCLQNPYVILKETPSNFIQYSTYDTFNILIAKSDKGVVMKIFQDGQPIDKNQDTVGYGAFGIPIKKDRATKLKY